MNKQRIRVITESALAVALCVVLNFLHIRLPFNVAGGSISLVMLPIAIVALRRGPGAGALVGCLFGIIDLIIDPYVLHWVQVLLDYPVPYLLFGFGAGLLQPVYKRLKGNGGKIATIIIAFLIGGALRFSSHLVSGAVFFGSSAPVDQNVWLWSALYQFTYLIPSLIAVCLLTCLILPVLDKAVPVQRKNGNASEDSNAPSDTPEEA